MRSNYQSLNNAKILVADDEPDILEFITYNLKKDGYQVYAVSNGAEAVEKARQIKPDLVILDVMMPKMDGIQACSEIKSTPGLHQVAVIFLTARAEEFTEVAGFDAGADDYITKPIRPRVLLSRISAILRRSEKPAESAELDFGDLKINRERFVVTYMGKELQFPRKEFELLSLLASKPGKVFTREEILHSVWGDDVLVVDRTIDVHIRKIREKLNDRFITTVKGVGYKLEI